MRKLNKIDEKIKDAPLFSLFNDTHMEKLKEQFNTKNCKLKFCDFWSLLTQPIEFHNFIELQIKFYDSVKSTYARRTGTSDQGAMAPPVYIHLLQRSVLFAIDWKIEWDRVH